MSGAGSGPRAALRQRDFALLWSGQTVSLAGDGIFTVALAIETLRVDDHPVALSVVLAARLLPTVLLLLLSGVVVDRVRRRLAMLASDIVRGLAVMALAVLTATGSLRLGALIVIAIVFGVADAFFNPASTALVPELVPEELLVSAGALSSTSRVFAQHLLGPAVGGLIVAAAGTAWSFGLDGASFAVSAACLIAMHAQSRPPSEPRPPGSALRELRAGLAYVRSQPWLWVSILGAGFANFAVFSPLGVLIPLLVRHVLHRGPFALGLTLAAGGVGGLVATLTLGRRGAPRRPVTTIWVAWTLSCLAAASVGLASAVWAIALLYALGGALLMYGNALWTPLMQRLVPRELLGRASSVDWMASIALSPLGVIAGGLVAAVVGVRVTIVAGGLLASLTGLSLLIPGVRDPDRRRPPG